MRLTTGVNPIEQVLAHARQRPESIAIASADFTMTAGDLEQSVLRFAARLRQLGIGRGSVVGVSAHPAIEAVVTLALLHEGAVSLVATPAVLRSHADHIDLLVSDAPVHSSVRTITIDAAFLAGLGAVSIDIEPAQLGANDVCRIVFSSGTTGTPKGVEFTVAALLARTEAAHANWMPAEPFLCLLGADTVSYTLSLFWHVLHGRTHLIASTPQRNRAVIEKYNVRSVKTSPARLAELLDVGEGLRLESVQVAGSLLAPSLARRCEEALGLVPTYLYGATEVGTVVSGQVDAGRPHVVGRPVAGIDLELVDVDDRSITQPDTEGVIRFRGATMLDRYWLEQASTAFRDGWFYPGDIGLLSSDGELHLVGRSNDVVNANGAKFNLAELDVWLAELRIFADAASFSYATDDGTAVGIAFVGKPHVGPELAVEQLRARFPHLTVGTLLKLDAIPRNPLGKADRRALAVMSPERG